ncbi:uncharacterized protein LY89DRAFT_695211 [Mollisia scopiformis]|uniref:Uncharacterized protein n=1 Tax=Mollisia scopiformis TaxID=149040 RepID=A0A194XK71_MOLSC|nr:uncharacterized protein LY89DRAFT_695211 [Mollisia scopiformis]KUJ20605.1 hypothetical protein LY89DRAFT_695211 [Mollisia scopiformis]
MDPSKTSSIHTSHTASPLFGIFSLPRKVRDDIYRRVLVVAHPLYLFQQTGSEVVEIFAPERPVRWLALLYTNRQVHEEAGAVVYGLNHFMFMDTTRHQANLLQSFLNCIGSFNAGHLSHISINFPVAEIVKGQPGKIVLREDDLHSLKLLQEKCIKLTRLETLVHSYNSIGLAKESQDSDDSQFWQEALSQIDAQLKVIPSLSKTIVRFYNGPPTSEVVELMQRLRWVILPG